MVGKRLGADGRGFEPRRIGWAQEQFLSGDLAPLDGLVRSEVLESWTLSAEHVATDVVHAPLAADAPAQWAEGPIARAFRPLSDELSRLAVEGDFVAAVTDASGAIVWMAGGRTMRRRAEQIGFAPGGLWGEASVGTNALGLALRTGRPASVRATEHFAEMVRDWVCYSSPILSPVTGETLGVLDLSTTWARANPLALTTVSALARNLELMLVAQGDLRPSAGLRLDLLGGAAVSIDGQRITLPPRQVELLAILSLAPHGLTLEELHDRAHGDRPVHPNTTKAELSHLRRTVGTHLMSRPYRLDGVWTSDVAEVWAALRSGRLDDAVAAYRGPFVPRSESPAIEEHRSTIEMAVRSAVIAAPTASRLTGLLRAVPDDPYLRELLEPFLGTDS